MSAAIRALKARRAEALKKANAINDVAATENRDLTEAEQTELAALTTSIKGLNAQVEQAEFLANQSAGLRGDGSVDVGAARDVTTRENQAEDPKRGFRSLGDFAADVMTASVTGQPTKRLAIGAAAPSTFGGEGGGADGGFLIPPEFSAEIFNLSLMEDSLLPMVDNVPVSGNSMAFPKDETTPWGTDGVRAYWQSEGSAATATKPKFGTSVMRLNKLMALVPLTDELLADTSALNSYLPNLMSRSIRWKTNEAFITGSGAGQPMGMFTGAAAVTVAKDSGQAANTLSVTNLTGMIARLPPGSLARAAWLITPDAIPALFGLTIGNVPAYLPLSNPITGKVNWVLFGLPVIVSQHASAFSAAGDIRLIDGSYYRALTKAGGIETASSMHLYFDADATAFRTTFRVDGQPKLAAAIAQAKGSNTLSPFVQLGAR
jgi:HK97 family phage major capsid protein